jgi:multicomponent Na+:H+ antiporter subunit F
VNEWIVAGAGFAFLVLPAGLLAMRGGLFERVIAMQLASTFGTLALVVLAQGFERDVYFDLAVVTAVLSFVGTMFYLKIMEMWL